MARDAETGRQRARDASAWNGSYAPAMSESVSADPRIGTELAGYRIEALVGRGGMGVVRARPEGRPEADLANGEIRVEVAFDFKSKIMVDPKSESSVRVVPIDGALRDDLVEHRMRNGRNEGLVFGRSAKKPFSLSGVTTPARRVWLAAGLEPVTLHECRHCFTSTMLAAGVDVPTIAKYLGHSSTELIPTRRYPPPGGG